MQKTLNFKPDSIVKAILNIYWLLVFGTIAGTVVIRIITKNSYLKTQSLMLISIFLLASFVLFGVLFLGFIALHRANFKLAEVNQNQSGLWISRYTFRHEQLYVPFDWLTVTKTGDGVRLSWERALRLDRKQRPKLQPTSGITLSNRWFNKNELANFLATVTYLNNGATGSEPKMKSYTKSTLTKKAREKGYKQIVLMLAVFLIGNGIVTFGKAHEANRVAATESHKKVQLKANTTYQSRNLTFKIHHIYQATNIDDERIMIVNMTATPRNKNATLDASCFEIYKKWSDANEVNFEGYSEATNMIGSQVKINGIQKPIVNVLDLSGWDDDDYQSPVQKPFNVVIKRPKATSFDFVYQGFYFRYNLPDEDDDTSIVFHVKTADLEVLK